MVTHKIVVIFYQVLIDQFYKLDTDYFSNTLVLSFPDGLDVEIFKPGVLEILSELKPDKFEKEHVTLGVVNRKNIFSTLNYFNSVDTSHFRWTVDTLEDFKFVSQTFFKFKGQEVTFTLSDIMEYFQHFPDANRILRRN